MRTAPLRIASIDSPPVAPKRKPERKVVPALTVKEQRTAGQFIAAIAAGFLPVASFVIAHIEAPVNPWMWALVAAALAFSAPTLAEWATKWCRDRWKAWGFTILLEGVMVFSTVQYLAVAGAIILVIINCHSAWAQAGKAFKGANK
jgi:hypothetical protein